MTITSQYAPEVDIDCLMMKNAQKVDFYVKEVELTIEA